MKVAILIYETYKDDDQITVFTQLLKHIDQLDLYESIVNKRNVDLNTQIPNYICPSDLNNGGGGFSTSYVANAGRADLFIDPDAKRPRTDDVTQNVTRGPRFPGADGIFYDRSGPTPRRSLKKTGKNSSTILFTENVQAGFWYLPEGYSDKIQLLNHVAVVWDKQKFLHPKEPSPYLEMNGSTTDLDFTAIPLAPCIGSQGASPSLYWARPSSMHSGGANFVSVGGDAKFKDVSKMEYSVYVQLMCSDWARSSIFLDPSDRSQPPAWVNGLGKPEF